MATLKPLVSSGPTFSVGSLVTVQSRTWPGINKPGGAGKVTNIFIDREGECRLDVKYVVGGGTEKNIEAKFVEIQTYLDKRTPVRRKRMNIQHHVVDEKRKKKRNIKVTESKKIEKNVPTRVSEKSKKKSESQKIGTSYVGDEEDIDGIPREITIVSCCESLGSLTFNENLAKSARDTHIKKSLPRRIVNQAKNSRKISEFFQPFKKEVSSSPVSISPSNDRNNVNEQGVRGLKGTNTVVSDGGELTLHKRKPFRDSSNILSDPPHISPRKNLNEVVTNVNNSKDVVGKNQPKVAIEPVCRPDKQKDEDKQKIQTNQKCSDLMLKSVIQSEASNFDGNDRKSDTQSITLSQERYKKFRATFGEVVRKSGIDQISLYDLFTEINKADCNKKFEQSEILNFVKKLDGENIVMFVEDKGELFIL